MTQWGVGVQQVVLHRLGPEPLEASASPLFLGYLAPDVIFNIVCGLTVYCNSEFLCVQVIKGTKIDGWLAIFRMG